MAVQVRERPRAERQQQERAHLQVGEAVGAETRHFGIFGAQTAHRGTDPPELRDHGCIGGYPEQQEHGCLQCVDPGRATHAAIADIDIRHRADGQAADPGRQARTRATRQDVERIAPALDADQQIRQHQGHGDDKQQGAQAVRAEPIPHQLHLGDVAVPLAELPRADSEVVEQERHDDGGARSHQGEYDHAPPVGLSRGA